MQILTINNQNFEKPSKKPSNGTKVKIWGKQFFIAHRKNFFPRMLSQRENVRTSKFWRKSKEKNRNFFGKLSQGIKKGFDLGQKKFKIISCLCTFKYDSFGFKIFLHFQFSVLYNRACNWIFIHFLPYMANVLNIFLSHTPTFNTKKTMLDILGKVRKVCRW